MADECRAAKLNTVGELQVGCLFSVCLGREGPGRVDAGLSQNPEDDAVPEGSLKRRD